MNNEEKPSKDQLDETKTNEEELTDEKILKKKQFIAEKFLEYFKQHGMVKTIVTDVARDLHISKKTIYKYFNGGKEECLYFFFNQLALVSINSLEPAKSSSKSSWEYLCTVIQHIFQVSISYVLDNPVEREQDYLIENQIVGEAFRNAYAPLVIGILDQGKQQQEFQITNLQLTYNFIYAILLETFAQIHKTGKKELIEDAIYAIKSLLKVDI
jgi:hypothetical protein